jgi:hypothetical protein
MNANRVPAFRPRRRHGCRARPFNDGIKIRDELFAGDMAMRIGHVVGRRSGDEEQVMQGCSRIDVVVTKT